MAGVAGSLTYAALLYIGFTPKATLLLMLIVPLVQLTTFCIVLKEPHRFGLITSVATSTTSLIDHTTSNEEDRTDHPPLSFKQKIEYSPIVFRNYVLPLFAVYISEYFINQGLVSAQ